MSEEGERPERAAEIECMTNDELMAKAENIERRANGDVYATFPVGSLTAEEFSDLIMGEVRRLQSARASEK